MKIQTEKLVGAALDWAVAKAEGEPIVRDPMGNMGSGIPRYWIWDDAGPLRKRRYLGIGEQYAPSANWALAGPIIERELITVEFNLEWYADKHGEHGADGPTPLTAAMRCYVASKLGDEVEIPDELLGRSH